MRLSVLLVLVLCVVLCAGDRARRQEQTGDEQQRVQQRPRDDGTRHHHHDNQRRQHHNRADHDDGDDSDDDEDDDDDDHHHHRRFVEVADADGGHWRHSHDHHDHPEADADGHRRGHDNRQDGHKVAKKVTQQDKKKNGQKDGQYKPDKRQGGDGGDGERHQDRHRSMDHHTESRHHRGDNASKKSHHSQSSRRSDGRPAQGRPSAEAGPQSEVPEVGPPSEVPETGPLSDPSRVAGEAESGGLPLSTEASSSPAAESLAAALSAPEPADPLLSDSDEAVDAEATPPPHQDVAAMARYVVHVSDWAAMATISTRSPTRGMPFANVFSVCDGTRYRSTGIPYLYLTDMEISVQDLRVNNSASLTMSLAQTSFCRQRGYDPEDPLCAHVILSGRVLQVDEQAPEYAFARDALFARHPEMSGWPAGHHFFVAKLDIKNIIVLDYFGGAKTVPVQEYFATDAFKLHPRRANML